jgi:hypothetical protein
MPALSILVLVLAADLDATARASKYWVFFADKGCVDEAETAAALGELAQSYNPRGIERRCLRRTAAGRPARAKKPKKRSGA